MILQNCLKLLVIWAKHMWHTSRGVDDLSKIDYNQDIKHLQAQKAFEDGLDDSKKPDASKMTLAPITAAASFTQMKAHLAKCRGKYDRTPPQVCGSPAAQGTSRRT